MTMDVVIHVAVAENDVIGRDGGMPWKLSSDLKRFKAETMGKPVIMGRKTFETLGRPLPGRLNIVITRNREWKSQGVEVAGSLDEALRLARVRARCMDGVEEICVIGGGQIYADAMAIADRLNVTHVEASPEGDTRFPPIDPDVWRLVESVRMEQSEKDSHPARFALYERIDAGA